MKRRRTSRDAGQPTLRRLLRSADDDVPSEFKRAQAEARQAKRRRWTFAREPRHPEEVFVVFDSRTARRRFESKPTTRRRPFSHLKHPRAAPFFTLLHSDLSSKEPMTPSVVVWSTETGKNVGDAR